MNKGLGTMSSSTKQTPSQTVGPYFALGMTPSQYNYPGHSKVSNVIRASGKAIKITGNVYDGNADNIDDGLIEIWQADSNGCFDTEDFVGFARSSTGTSAGGGFLFETIKPGSAGPGQAPYLSVIVFMRGLLVPAFTRLYFADEAEANQEDIVLQQLPAARVPTLLAQPVAGTDSCQYQFDIRMQGDRETIFFDI